MFLNYKRRPDLPGGPGHSGESGSRGSLDRSPALAGAGRERRASYWLRPLSITEKRSNLVQKPGPANRVPRGAPRFLLRPAGPGRGAAAGCPERAALGVRGSVRFRAARTCRCPASREPGRQTSFHSGPRAGRAQPPAASGAVGRRPDRACRGTESPARLGRGQVPGAASTLPAAGRRPHAPLGAVGLQGATPTPASPLDGGGGGATGDKTSGFCLKAPPFSKQPRRCGLEWPESCHSRPSVGNGCRATPRSRAASCRTVSAGLCCRDAGSLGFGTRVGAERASLLRGGGF